MIAYLYLSVALIAGLVKGLSGKRISRDVVSLNDGFAVNVIRSVFCACIGFLVLIIQVGFSGLELSLEAFLVCLASSIFMALFCISWLYAYKTEAYAFLNIFTMLGSVITAFLGWAIYGDEISSTRIIGFVLLFIAVYIMSLYNKNLKGKMDKRGVITLILGCFGVALSDFMQKVFVKQSLGAPSTFTFYTYAIMIIPQLLVLMLFKAKKTSNLSKNVCDKRHVGIYLIISIALYVNVIMKTMAVADIPSTQLYPTLQGANLIASAICASIFFKEKMTKKSIVGICVALAAAILMNI